MRHIASWRDGNMVQYALVDEETGELNEFARLQVPEHFDFEASALLGTNLATVLGFDRNGAKPKAKAKQPAPTPEPEVPAPSRRRVPSTAGRPKRTPTGKLSKGGTEFYISEEQVLGVIADYPEGLQVREIAERLWRLLGDGSEAMPRWVIGAVGNRLHIMKARSDRDGTPMPYVQENRQMPNQDGTLGGRIGRWVRPVEAAS